MHEPPFEELLGSPPPSEPIAKEAQATPPELGYAARWRAPLGAFGAMDAALTMLRARPGVFFCIVVCEVVLHSCRHVLEAFLPKATGNFFINEYFGPPSWAGWILDPPMMGVIFAAFACVYHGTPAHPGKILRTALGAPFALYVVDSLTNLIQITSILFLVLPFVFVWGWIVFALPHVVLGRASFIDAFRLGFRDGGRIPRAMMGFSAMYVASIIAISMALHGLDEVIGALPTGLLIALVISPIDAFFMLAVTWLYFELRAGWQAPAREG